MTTSGARRPSGGEAEPSLPYEDWLVEQLKDPAEAAAYLEAALEQGHQGALMLALRHVAMAQGGIAEVARRAKLTREAAYRILSESGNPELRSLSAILAASGLKLSVKPIGKPPGVAQGRAKYRVSRRTTKAARASGAASVAGILRYSGTRIPIERLDGGVAMKKAAKRKRA